MTNRGRSASVLVTALFLGLPLPAFAADLPPSVVAAVATCVTPDLTHASRVDSVLSGGAIALAGTDRLPAAAQIVLGGELITMIGDSLQGSGEVPLARAASIFPHIAAHAEGSAAVAEGGAIKGSDWFTLPDSDDAILWILTSGGKKSAFAECYILLPEGTSAGALEAALGKPVQLNDFEIGGYAAFGFATGSKPGLAEYVAPTSEVGRAAGLPSRPLLIIHQVKSAL